jgi:hypothetical protein
MPEAHARVLKAQLIGPTSPPSQLTSNNSLYTRPKHALLQAQQLKNSLDILIRTALDVLHNRTRALNGRACPRHHGGAVEAWAINSCYTMTGQPVLFVQTLIGQLDGRTISKCIHLPEGDSRYPCLVDSILECRRVSAGCERRVAICIPLYRILTSFSFFFFIAISTCLS